MTLAFHDSVIQWQILLIRLCYAQRGNLAREERGLIVFVGDSFGDIGFTSFDFECSVSCASCRALERFSDQEILLFFS